MTSISQREWNTQSDKLKIDIEKLSARLNSAGFTDKAPAAVVDKVKGELADMEDQLGKVMTSLAALPDP